MWSSPLLAVALVLASFGALGGQTVPLLEPGDQIRLVSPAHRGVFYVTEWSAPTLVIRAPAMGQNISIPRESVQSLDVRRGYARGESLLRGMGIGFLAGATAGVTLGVADGDDPPDEWFALTAAEKAMIGVVILGGGSALLGSVIGAVAPRSRWVPVELPVRVGLMPLQERGVRIALFSNP
jgi:hypothetical protein